MRQLRLFDEPTPPPGRGWAYSEDGRLDLLDDDGRDDRPDGEDFEAYLRKKRWQFVAVDNARRAIFARPQIGGFDLLVHFADAEELGTVKRTAAEAGMTQKAFCRRAILDAATRATGPEADNALGILRQIRDHVCGRPVQSMADTEAEDAVTALVGLGMPRRTAVERVGGITAGRPGLSAGSIVAEACRQGGQ